MKPVSKTAYYCCGVRMLDASSPKPLINDLYAKALMGEEGMVYWENYKKYTSPNGSNIARCYLIDQWVKKQLDKNSATTIILVGAGLDSRAYRLPGGNWIELDEPGIIEYKNQKLPSAQCENPLQRISIDFAQEKVRDKLMPFVGLTPVVIIVEGVLMYLTQAQRKELLTTLTQQFPNHILLCDLMNFNFFNRLGKKSIHEEFSKSGASFQDIQVNPEQLMIDFGYKLEEKKSNVITASDHGLINIPRIFVKFFMKKLMMGYSSYQFRFGS